MTVNEQLDACFAYVSARIHFQPEIALVLGSGLGGFADTIDVKETLDYSEIPGFPVSTVAGHAGRFVFGFCEGVPVAVMQGRVHMYEGYTAQEAVLPIRLLHLMGAKTLFLTNAAGGIQAGMQAGEFMLITDQISSFVPSPLRGENIESLGVRFPDMSEIYSKRLQTIIRKIAVNADIPLKEGVYLQTAGPAYESPAEIRMFRALGADAVGMSTAIEAIAARHCGMEICGVSCISNLAAGISPHPLSHEEVKEAGDKAAPQFTQLVREVIKACYAEQNPDAIIAEYKIPLQYQSGKHALHEMSADCADVLVLSLDGVGVLTYSVPEHGTKVSVYNMTEQLLQKGLHATYDDSGMLKYIELIADNDVMLIYIGYRNHEDAKAEVLDFAVQSADIMLYELRQLYEQRQSSEKAARLFIEYDKGESFNWVAAKIGFENEKQTVLSCLPNRADLPDFAEYAVNDSRNYPRENRIECDRYTLEIMLECAAPDIRSELLNLIIEKMIQEIDAGVDMFDKTDDFRLIVEEYE